MDELATFSENDLPGDLAARFTGVVELGRGAFGRVVRADDSRLGRPVALKLLNPFRSMDPGARARFEREAQLCSRLSSAFFPRVYDFGIVEEIPYIVFELLRGRALGRYLRERPAGLPEPEVARLLERILEALAVLHENGILHRDVKPDNVLMLEGGGIALIDLGLGLAPDSETLTRTGNLVGTPLYLSPDVLRGGEWGEGNDLYALALIGVQALCGRLPMVGQNLAGTLQLREQGPAAWLAQEGVVLGPTWAKVLLAALDPRPGRRPASARGLLAELRAAAGIEISGNAPTVALPPPPEERSERARKRRPRRPFPVPSAQALGALAGVLLVLVAALAWPRTGPAPATGLLRDAAAALRLEVEANPEVAAALGLEGVFPEPALLETWRRGRSAFRRLVARHGLRDLLEEAGPVELGPDLADPLGRLLKIQVLLDTVRSSPPLFDPDEDPRLAARLGTAIRTVEAPAPGIPLDLGPASQDELYLARLEKADRGYASWLARGGAGWTEVYDGTEPLDPLHPEIGSRARLRVVNGAGRPHQWIFGRETDMFTLGMSKYARVRFDRSPSRAEFPVAAAGADLVLAMHVEGLGRDRPAWLELESGDRILGALLVPERPRDAPPKLGSDTHQLVLVRILAGTLPPGARLAGLSTLGLQPIGRPDPTVLLAHVWALRAGPVPAELGP